MKATPAASIAFLRERIRPAPPPASDVARLVADLDNDDFAQRKKATAELAKRGRKVEAELRQAYEKQPSTEMRYRLEILLARLKDVPNEETAKVRAQSRYWKPSASATLVLSSKRWRKDRPSHA